LLLKNLILIPRSYSPLPLPCNGLSFLWYNLVWLRSPRMRVARRRHPILFREPLRRAQGS
jgi:hypothetical protein